MSPAPRFPRPLLQWHLATAAATLVRSAQSLLGHQANDATALVVTGLQEWTLGPLDPVWFGAGSLSNCLVETAIPYGVFVADQRQSIPRPLFQLDQNRVELAANQSTIPTRELKAFPELLEL